MSRREGGTTEAREPSLEFAGKDKIPSSRQGSEDLIKASSSSERRAK